MLTSAIRRTEKRTEEGERLKYRENEALHFLERDKLRERHAHSNLHNGDLLTLFSACLVDSIHTVQHPIR